MNPQELAAAFRRCARERCARAAFWATGGALVSLGFLFSSCSHAITDIQSAALPVLAGSAGFVLCLAGLLTVSGAYARMESYAKRLEESAPSQANAPEKPSSAEVRTVAYKTTQPVPRRGAAPVEPTKGRIVSKHV